jgi:hypothetical protein
MESDTGHYKYGDGVTAWNTLAYDSIISDFTRSYLNELQSIAYNAGTPSVAKSGNYDMSYADGIIEVTTGANEIIIKLPNPALCSYTFNGVKMLRIYQVVKVDSGAGRVKLIPFSTEKILGEDEQWLNVQYENLTFYTNGSNYFER